VENLRRKPLSRDELFKVKKQVRSHFLRSLQTFFFQGLLAGLYQVRAGISASSMAFCLAMNP